MKWMRSETKTMKRQRRQQQQQSQRENIFYICLASKAQFCASRCACQTWKKIITTECVGQNLFLAKRKPNERTKWIKNRLFTWFNRSCIWRFQLKLFSVRLLNVSAYFPLRFKWFQPVWRSKLCVELSHIANNYIVGLRKREAAISLN